MRTKTPSSLKWLVDKRARLAGTIARYENEAKAARLFAEGRESRNKELRKDLRAIDRALAMHEVGVDPKMISAIGTQKEPRLLPRGHLTRRILTCLRRANGEWRSTLEVMTYVVTSSGIEIDVANQAHVRLCVRRRLKNLHVAGRVVRQHGRQTSREGSWKLPTD